jgi:hypothetical protein
MENTNVIYAEGGVTMWNSPILERQTSKAGQDIDFGYKQEVRK